MNPTTLTTGLLATLTLCLAACGGSHTETRTARGATPPAGDARSGSTLATAGGDTATREACALPAVFFEYDSAELTSGSRDALARAATCLKQEDVPLRLVGATDPRGTEEYNLALGEQRARTVAHYLAALGVPDARVHVTSVGEEESRGSDESGWAQDRWVKDR